MTSDEVAHAEQVAEQELVRQLTINEMTDNQFEEWLTKVEVPEPKESLAEYRKRWSILAGLI